MPKNENTTHVATNDGTLVAVPDLVVPAVRINGFVEAYRKEYFEDHSLNWALDEILACGMREIKRTVKNNVRVAKDRAAGKAFAALGVNSVEDLKAMLAKLQSEKSEAAKAEAAE